MNMIVKPITPDGNTGFDEFGQLMSFVNENGYRTGHMIRDVRNMSCYICGKGWELTTLSLRDQDQIDQRMPVHASCYYGYQKVAEYFRLQNALIEAGYLFQLSEEPPQYPGSTPWQLVQVKRADAKRSDTYHRIMLGRRKRVWEIRFINSNVPQLFTDVSDTRGYHDGDDGTYYYIHAWTVEQLVDYLRRFRETIPNTNRASL